MKYSLIAITKTDISVSLAEMLSKHFLVSSGADYHFKDDTDDTKIVSVIKTDNYFYNYLGISDTNEISSGGEIAEMTVKFLKNMNVNYIYVICIDDTPDTSWHSEEEPNIKQLALF